MKNVIILQKAYWKCFFLSSVCFLSGNLFLTYWKATFDFLYRRKTSIIKIFNCIAITVLFLFQGDIFQKKVNMINLLWKAVEGYYVCMHFYLFPHILQRILTNCLCRCDSCEPFTGIFIDLSECVHAEQKKLLCLVNVHYGPLVHMASLPTHWWQGSRGETHLLAFTAALFCPCLLV